MVDPGYRPKLNLFFCDDEDVFAIGAKLNHSVQVGAKYLHSEFLKPAECIRVWMFIAILQAAGDQRDLRTNTI